MQVWVGQTVASKTSQAPGKVLGILACPKLWWCSCWALWWHLEGPHLRADKGRVQKSGWRWLSASSQRSWGQQSRDFALPAQNSGGEGCCSQQSMGRASGGGGDPAWETSSAPTRAPWELGAPQEAKPRHSQLGECCLASPGHGDHTQTALGLLELLLWAAPLPRAPGMAAPLDQKVTHYWASPVKQDKYNFGC